MEPGLNKLRSTAAPPVLLLVPSAPRSGVSWCSPPVLIDEAVGEVGEALTDGLGVEEAHGLLVAGLAEEALAGTEHDREDDQPQLVDQVVLDQRAPELIAGVDDDFPVQLPA